MTSPQALLVHAAQLHGDEAFYQELATKAASFTDWRRLPEEAEAHGLGPLLYRHLQAAPVQFPPATKEALQGLYLRHRHANQVRLNVLAELLATFEQAGVAVLLLKGAALVNLIYPQPGLRPMRDLDLLVHSADIPTARHLLEMAGFSGPATSQKKLPDKHLPTMGKKVGGFWVTIEIHHNLFNQAPPLSLPLDEVSQPWLPLELDGFTGYTLGYEQMLWHLCQHVRYHANVWEPLRFIWLVDIVGFAEQFAAEIDWSRIARQYPLVRKILALFHYVTPLSERLCTASRLDSGYPSPQHVGQDFAGWPRTSLATLRRHRSYSRILWDTFYPPEWWLRLHYGLGSNESLIWPRWVGHPLHILGCLRHFARQQAAWRFRR